VATNGGAGIQQVQEINDDSSSNDVDGLANDDSREMTDVPEFLNKSINKNQLQRSNTFSSPNTLIKETFAEINETSSQGHVGTSE